MTNCNPKPNFGFMDSIGEPLETLLQRTSDLREGLKQLEEILLSNLVMLGEIPSPTFHEEERVRFLLDRFRECSLDKISSDEVGNALGILTGTEGRKNILVLAHLDTLYPETMDHSVRIDTRTIQGAGIADNSLGVAVLASLPTLLEKLNLRLKSNLIFMGASRSLGRGNLQGLRFFLENQKIPVHTGICIEGVELGRLSYSSHGMLRGEIHCQLPEGGDWQETGPGGAISLITDVILRVQQIPLPQRPRTSIILGSCHAGKSFNKVPESGSLRLEIRSEQGGMCTRLKEALEEIIEEVSSSTGADLRLEIIARSSKGGIGFSHPLTVAIRRIMESLDLTPVITPSVGELSALIKAKIPGVTLGITRRAPMGDDSQETVLIDPMVDGLTQLVLLLLAIDSGNLDDQDEE